MAISDQELEEALIIAAKIIDLYGYIYWPIFERLEAELTTRRHRVRRVQATLERDAPLSQNRQVLRRRASAYQEKQPAAVLRAREL